MRKEINFNEAWKFFRGDSENYAAEDWGDEDWKTLDLPHDWSTEWEPDQKAPTGGGGGFATAGTGWYRKRFVLQEVEADERIFLYFEGAYMDVSVFINGQKAGWHGYGFGSFEVELSGKVRPGQNVVAVRVDNSRQPNCRWYSGSGITRNVRLVRTYKVHVGVWGVRCDTNGIYRQQQEASLQIRTLVRNQGDEPACVDVTHVLYDQEGNEACVSGTALYLDPGRDQDCMVRPLVERPHLWTDQDPYLYTLVTTVSQGGKETDRTECRVGIRTAVFDCDRGFLLNGQSVKIKGMCLHHDCGLTGAVGYREIWERRLRALKEMGCNGLRCAHNPPDPVFLDLCDELGFLVMDEIFDEWRLTKHKINNYYSQNFAYGSSQYFDRYAKEELTAMLRRDYNHPSVILWSIGNEIPEQSSLDGVKILRYLQDICHEEDSSRMVTCACDNIAAPETNRTLREFENALDVVGYNYVGRWGKRAENFYEEDRVMFPTRRMIGSENPSVGGKRGDYSGPYAKASLHHEALWRYTASHDFVAGDYLWTGIDYLGETRWPYRGASCGVLDTAGFKKDSYYYFRSIWNEKDITLHLLPHWNWKGEEGTFKQVVCYTNCDEVKLFLNGKEIGVKGYECPRKGAWQAWNDPVGIHATTNDLHLSWDVPYEPGTLRAEGFKDQKLVAVEEVVTTKEAAALEIRAERTLLYRGQLCPIELYCVDEDGRQVPDAGPMVSCSIEGPARLVGMDAGDLADLSLYSSPRRKMLAGAMLAVIKAVDVGRVKLTFSAEGLGQKEIVLDICSE